MDRFGKLCRNASEKIQKNSERKRALTCHVFALSPMGAERISEKASFCTVWNGLKKASLTVETAMVLPIFLFGLITLISFMDLYRIETKHLTELCQRAKEAGMYAYVRNGEGLKEITLPDVYAYEPMGGLFSLPKIWQHNVVKVHGWTGKRNGGGNAATEMEPMVYVTESGSVFHRKPGCSYLNLSINQVSGRSVKGLRNQYGERYLPCETCSKNGTPAGSVFITRNGDRYHNLENCSGLKRTVRMVKQSEVKGMGVCSRCG